MFAEGTTLILGFIARSVFIKVLGEEYLGINGLFLNILNVLSFAELGLGDAIIFGLYKPILHNDRVKTAQYVRFYKKAYLIIGAIVAVLGLCLTPFLGVIIQDKPDIPESLTLIYLLYLLNTVCSYLYVWKRTFMDANQERYIGTILDQIFTFIQIVFQIIFLYKTKSFVIYLLIMIISNQVRNVIISAICTKRYPVVKDRPTEKLPKEEKQTIFNNVKGLLVYKLSGVALEGTDNILLELIISLRSVALYSNYSVITVAFRKLANQILNGVTASVGNLNAGDDAKSKESVFFRLLFTSFWFYALLCTGFASVVNSLITAWVGERFALGTACVLAITFSFYVEGMQFTGFTYRTTMGIFKESRVAPVAAAILNVVLSVILGKAFGMAGVFAATGVSRLLTTTWVDAYLVFKTRLNKSAARFFMMYGIYFLFTALAYVVCSRTIALIPVAGWGGVAVKMAVCFAEFNALFLICFIKTRVFGEVAEMFLGKIKSAMRGRRK